MDDATFAQLQALVRAPIPLPCFAPRIMPKSWAGVLITARTVGSFARGPHLSSDDWNGRWGDYGDAAALTTLVPLDDDDAFHEEGD